MSDRPRSGSGTGSRSYANVLRGEAPPPPIIGPIKYLSEYVLEPVQFLAGKPYKIIDPKLLSYVRDMETREELKRLLRHPFLMSSSERQAYPLVLFTLLEAVLGSGWRWEMERHLKYIYEDKPVFKEAEVVKSVE